MEKKAVLEPLWKYVRPVSQRRLRMTCKTIRNMTENWPLNIPDIKELEDDEKIKDWLLESNSLPPEEAENVSFLTLIENYKRWKWKFGKTYIDLLFYKFDDDEIYYLTSIMVYYKNIFPEKESDYFYNQINLVVKDFFVHRDGNVSNKTDTCNVLIDEWIEYLKSSPDGNLYLTYRDYLYGLKDVSELRKKLIKLEPSNSVV